MLFAIMMLTSVSTLFSQTVTFKMKRPPLNQLRAADLWNAAIINGGEPFTAYLYGSMTNNENGELIATGQTMTFEVKKGTVNFKVSDLSKVPDISYLSKDPKYKESFMNTGGAPAGDYKICVELRYTNNSVAGEDCFDQKIMGGDAPQLISPRDEEELKIDNPVFTWMHMKGPGSNQTYTLKIIELKGNDSPENAILKNKAFFEKEGIREQMFQYPVSGPKFEEGKTYGWQVSAGDLKSQLNTFRYIPVGVNIIIPPVGTGKMCDVLNAVPVNTGSAVGGDCCWSLNMTHPANTSNINSIQFLALAPNSFVTGSSHLNPPYNTGWTYPVNSGQEFTIRKLGSGSIPAGQLNSFFSFCLNKVSSPQKVVINWKTDAAIVCSDTVTLNCDIPCVTIRKDTVLCNGNNYNLSYSFTNNTTYSIDKIEVEGVTPSGVSVSPSPFTLSTPVAPNASTSQPAFTITGAVPGSTVCINLKYISSNGCCWCYDTLCVVIPSCICDEVSANISAGTGDPLNCCYSLNIQNNFSGNYFTQINLRPLESGVNFNTWITNTANNFHSTNVYPDNVIHLINDPANFPNSFIPMGNSSGVINFCLHGYTTLTQHVIVEWMRNDSVKCIDTIETHCQPLPPPKPCSQLINDTLTCLGNNTFLYTFHVKNNSTYDATGFQFDAVSPSGLTFASQPIYFSPSLQAGMISTQQSVIISGVSPGSQFCYTTSLFQHTVVNGVPYYGWCCHSDTICTTAPFCGGDPVDSCSCKQWQRGEIKIEGKGLVKSIRCDSSYTINPISNVTLTYPQYLCTPSSCNASYSWNITGPIPQSGTTNVISNADFSLPGSYVISMVPACGTHICDTCKIFVVVRGGDPVDSCGCGEKWNPHSVISYNPTLTNIVRKEITCFAKTIYGPMAAGSNVSYTANAYNCNRPGCLPSYNWKVIDVNLNSVVNSGTSSSLPVNFPAPSEGNYKFIVYPVCDGKVCDSCSFYFKTKGDIKCECSDTKWKQKGIEVEIEGKGPQLPIQCGRNLDIDLPSKVTLTFPEYICDPVDCKATYTWDLRGGSGFVPVHETGTTNQFSYIFNTPGSYTLWMKAYCGGKACDSCLITFKVKASDCGCGEKWKTDNSVQYYEGDKKVSKGFKCFDEKYIGPVTGGTTMIYNTAPYTCKQKICAASYEWKVFDTSNNLINSGVSASLPINFPAPSEGKYRFVVYPVCGGVKCDSCSFNFYTKGGTDCNCNEDASFSYSLGTGTIDPKRDDEKKGLIKKGEVKCKGTIIAAYGSVLIFTPLNLCTPKDCLKDYSYEIFDLSSGSYVTGQSNTGNIPFSITVNSSAGYRVLITYNCNGKKCTCEFYIRTKDVVNDCGCGEWKDKAINFNVGMISGTVMFNGNLTVMQGISYSFTAPAYICAPVSHSCLPVYTWRVNGVVRGTGQTLNYGFTGSENLISVTTMCGGKICDSAKFAVNPRSETPCDSLANRTHNDSTSFINSFTSSQEIHFDNNDDGSPMSNPAADNPLSNWVRSGFTFSNARTYYNTFIYGGSITVVFPAGMYKKVGFAHSTFSGAPGTYVIKVTSGNCVYTFNRYNTSYFGVTLQTPIDKIEVTCTVGGAFIIDNFRYGN